MGYTNIKTLCGLFFKCKALKEIPDISKWNTANVFDISYLFYGCSSLISLPDISKWNTNNIIILNCLFFNCSSLISLPDISKWNLFNSNLLDYIKFIGSCGFFNHDEIMTEVDKEMLVEEMKYDNIYLEDVFHKKRPSKLSLKEKVVLIFEKAYSLNGLFSGCSSLKYLPNIDTWDIKKTKDINNMFLGCTSLISLPDISKWNTKYIKYMECLFKNCSSLE